MKKTIAALAVLLAAGCASDSSYNAGGGSAANPKAAEGYVPPMDSRRKVSEQDCSKLVDTGAGNLMCREVTEAERQAERRRLQEEERQRKLAAERRAKMEEEERQAKARKEAEERAARERLERERAEQLAREAAALKARAADAERLAAERRRLEDERKAREERERQEKAEAEARGRQLAEQQAREAAERERARLEQEWLAGRALLERFVANYGKVEKFKDVAEPITGFLDKTR